MDFLLLAVLVVAVIWALTPARKRQGQARQSALPRQPVVRPAPVDPQGVAAPAVDADDDRDSWDGWFVNEASDPTPSNARLRITYLDRNGLRTERDINVREFDNAPDRSRSGMLMAHCTLRDATRTFRYERIEKAIDRESGEVVGDVQRHLRALWTSSPDFSLRQFQADFARPLEVLLFVAKSDGRVVAKEREVLVQFCRAHLADRRVTDEALERALKDVRTVTLQSFKLSVSKLATDQPAILPSLVSAAERIVGAEKTRRPAEEEALQYLTRRAVGALNAK